MNQTSNNEKTKPEEALENPPRTFFSRFLQPIGALIVTAIAMWYLLGIPASILWEPFYQRLTGAEESELTEHIFNEENP